MGGWDPDHDANQHTFYSDMFVLDTGHAVFLCVLLFSQHTAHTLILHILLRIASQPAAGFDLVLFGKHPLSMIPFDAKDEEHRLERRYVFQLYND